MAGMYPATPEPVSVTVTSVSPTLKSVTHSGRLQTRSRVGQQWAFTVNYSAMTRAEFSPLWSFLVDQDGQGETFDFVLPHHDVQGAGTGLPKVDGSHSIGDKTIQSDGWGVSQTVMKAGDFLRFGSATKMYMTTADVVSDGSGDATINISPGLRSAAANNDDVTFWPVQFKCSLATDITTIDVDQCLKYTGFSVQLIERL